MKIPFFSKEEPKEINERLYYLPAEAEKAIECELLYYFDDGELAQIILPTKMVVQEKDLFATKKLTEEEAKRRLFKRVGNLEEAVKKLTGRAKK